MSLKDTIKEDMKVAFKGGDQATRSTLGMLLSVIQNREIEKRTKGGDEQLTDEEVIAAISTEIKKRKEGVAQYEAAGRADTAAAEQAEIAVLSKYLPEQLTEDDVKKLIADAIAGGAKDMGRVMGAISSKIKGRFDGARANALVKEALA
jgi:uncharacterized protein YqeY